MFFYEILLIKRVTHGTILLPLFFNGDKNTVYFLFITFIICHLVKKKTRYNFWSTNKIQKFKKRFNRISFHPAH